MANEAAATVTEVLVDERSVLRQRQTEVLSRLFAHEVVRPSSPLTGFICLRDDYTHPGYPGVTWAPGSEHHGHFRLSLSPLGALSWLPSEDRLLLRVVECAATPESIIGGGHDVVEASKVVVTAELSKPLGAHSEVLQAFWRSLRPDPRGADGPTAVELATEALLRFRLFHRFQCVGISFVSLGVNRSGWWRQDPDGSHNDWGTAWQTAVAELADLRPRSISEAEWQLFATSVDSVIDGALSELPRKDLLRDHIMATSYALAAGPAATRENPFSPLVRLGLMGCPALGMVGKWFWIAAPPPLTGQKHLLQQSPFGGG